MKTLKLCRLLTMIASLAMFLVHLLPEIKGENGYDWMMIAILVVFLVLLPAGLMGSMAREKHPETLSECKKGYLVMQCVFSGVFICMCFASCIFVPGHIWLYIAFAFATTSHLFNDIILYKTRQAYEAEAKPEA